MLVNSVFLITVISTLVVLLLVTHYQQLRSNLQKNISLIVTLHHALMYQRQTIKDKSEFDSDQQEQNKRNQVFRDFAIVWLSMHHQHLPQHCEHPVEQNSWIDYREEQQCIRKIVNKRTIINIPLAVCINSCLKINYEGWSKCVEPNTHHPVAKQTSIRIELATLANETTSKGAAVIIIDDVNKRWQWWIE